MNGEPMVTPDPVVALLYGVLAYPSLRPGVSTTVDLLAGQPGPWTLPDVERAAAAEDLHARLLDGHARQVHSLLEVAAPSLRGAVEQLRQALGSEELVAELQGSGVLELALGLDQRAEQFLSALATAEQRAARGPQEVEDDQAELPAPDLADIVSWRRDELLAHLVALDLDPAAALATLRTAAERMGQTKPRTWAEVVGRRELLGELLAWIGTELASGRGHGAKAGAR